MVAVASGDREGLQLTRVFVVRYPGSLKLHSLGKILNPKLPLMAITMYEWSARKQGCV